MGKLKRRALLAVYGILMVVTVVLVWKLGAPSPVEQKIGFITAGDVESPGWNAITYHGIQTACKNMGARLVSRWGVAEGDGSCARAVQELVDEGAKMIVLNSYSYSNEMREHLDEYPNIAFFASAADYNTANLTSFSTRLYQVRYLSGIVAGFQTKTNKIGFVAASKEDVVYRGINAFALGVRRVNPEAEVIVAWTGSWDNAKAEQAAAEALIQKEQVDVITYHQDQPYVIEVAEAAGIASIGYYEAVKNVSERYLTCAVCDWVPLYEQLIREFQRGQSRAVESDWLGIESGVVELTKYSPLVSQEAKDEVSRATKEILSGQDVFTNVIYDNEGNLRCGEGEAISDETLLWDINWLVEGVREYEK